MSKNNKEEEIKQDFLGELYENRTVEINYHLSRFRLAVYSVIGLLTTLTMFWATLSLTDTILQKVVFALVALFGVFVTIFAFVYFCASFNIR